MPKSLVVGIGNPLLGADAFGPGVIDRLSATQSPPAGVVLLHAHTDLLSCLDQFSGYDEVIIVDAVLGDPPRRVVIVSEETFGSWETRSTGAHAVSPVAAVLLFRQLYAAASTRISLVALIVDERSFGAAVTADEIDAGAMAVLRLIQKR